MLDLDLYGLSDDSALFYNVDGIPVTIGHSLYPGCMAWDVIPPRPCRVESLQRNGWMVGFSEFVRLLTPSDNPDALVDS